jgi:membrane-bound serine protease (ClpP class)
MTAAIRGHFPLRLTGEPNMRRILLILLAALTLLAGGEAAADVLRIRIDGAIHPVTDEYIARALNAAEGRRAEAVLIELRTPGGLEESTRRIISRIMASKVPVIVWVTPEGGRAASAGFFILISADVAAMSPGTNTGAATPVTLVGGDKVDEVMKRKMTSDSAAFVRSVAARRGRNVAAAEAAVVEAKSWSEEEALASQLIDFIARSDREVLARASAKPVRRPSGEQVKLELTNVPIREFEMTVRQKILSWLMDPNVAFILFSLGMLGIWAELNHPGAIVPGVVGVIAISLAIIAFNLLPTRYAALLLILLAFLLFFLEAKFTSHGILGAGGVLTMVIGALLLVDGPIPEMRVSLLTALAVSVPFGIIAIFLMTLALRAQKGRITTGEQGMVGEIGIARTPLAPNGKIFVHGELWDAVSPEPVEEGRHVVVRGMNGFVLEVDPVPAAEDGSPSGPAAG